MSTPSLYDQIIDESQFAVFFTQAQYCDCGQLFLVVRAEKSRAIYPFDRNKSRFNSNSLQADSSCPNCQQPLTQPLLLWDDVIYLYETLQAYLAEHQITPTNPTPQDALRGLAAAYRQTCIETWNIESRLQAILQASYPPSPNSANGASQE